MAIKKKDGVERKVTRAIDVGDDLQMHVSVLIIDGERFLDLRNFIPSAQTYGRGVVAPVGLAAGLAAVLNELVYNELRES